MVEHVTRTSTSSGVSAPWASTENIATCYLTKFEGDCNLQCWISTVIGRFEVNVVSILPDVVSLLCFEKLLKRTSVFEVVALRLCISS